MSAYYLAARYSRHPEMRAIRTELVAMGHTVTSRWIDQHGGDQLESAATAVLSSDPRSVAKYGEHDLEDIASASALISFTSDDGGGKGGRHVEHGYALGLRKQVIVVGPRENIFHTLPRLWHFPNWPSARRFFANEAPCRRCGLDNGNGTHDALQRVGHLSHDYETAAS